MQLNPIVAKAYFHIHYPAYEGSNNFIACLIYYRKVFSIKRLNRFISARIMFDSGSIKVTNLKLEV